MKKPFLSVCMIVKDEEKMLLQNLPSIAEVVEELIIVDTGSTDHTKEVAVTFTEHVYDFEWTNNFAEARNFAASKATGEWILALDADERIDANHFSEFIENLREKTDEADAYMVNITNVSDQGAGYSFTNQMVRLYRNDGSMQYERALHEQLVKVENGEKVDLKLKEMPLEITHFGYLSAIVVEKGKLERNIKILEQSSDVDKEDGFYFYNRAQHFLVEAKHEEALENLIEAHKRLGTNQVVGWLVPCIIKIAHCLIELKRYKDALAVIEDAEIVFPKNPDLPINRAKIYDAQGRFDDAKEVLHIVLSNINNFDVAVVIRGGKDIVPNEMLGDIYEKEKDYQNAITHYLHGFGQSYSYSLLRKIVMLLLKVHTEEEVFAFLTSKELVKIDEFILSLAKELLNEGYGELAEGLMGLIETKTEALLQSAKTKRKIIELDCQLEQFTNILTEAEVQQAMNSNFLNLGDFCFLYFKTNDPYLKPFFDKACASLKEDKKIYLSILERAIRLGKGPFVEFLLDLGYYDASLKPEVADLFFKHGYQEIALNFYEEINEQEITKQGFENVVEFLIEQHNIEEAVRIAQLAIELFDDNFVFYKYVIENTENNSEFIDKASEKYGDSSWLQQQSFLVDFF